jgi:2-keto-3-deoxy-L-rhamnonate aldolase RhmA
MNVRAIQALRRRLARDEPVHGLWVTLEAAGVAEMAVALGLDWIVVDAEHGAMDWRDIVGHVRAAVRSETVVLVRLAQADAGLIKRALDIGADGVVLPWIESAEQLSRAVAWAQYPPAGRRGMGAERATGWGSALARHVAEANPHVLVVPIIESVAAARDIEAIGRVPGVEILMLGPADFSATAGYPGQWEGPGVAEQLLDVLRVARRHGRHCGIMATGDDDLIRRRDQGFRFLGLGLDTGFLLRGLAARLALVGRPATIAPDLVPERVDESRGHPPGEEAGA